MACAGELTASPTACSSLAGSVAVLSYNKFTRGLCMHGAAQRRQLGLSRSVESSRQGTCCLKLFG